MPGMITADSAFAIAMTAAFAIGAIARPKLAFIMLICSIPLFLGDRKFPYMYVIDILTGIFLVSMAIHIRKNPTPVNRRLAPVLPVLLLCASAITALPAETRETVIAWHLLPKREVLARLFTAAPQLPEYYFSNLYFVFTSAGVYLSAVYLFPADRARNIAFWFAGILAGFTFEAILQFYKILPVSGFFFSLSFEDWRGMLTGISFNPHYWAQFVIIFMPFLMAAVFMARSKAGKITLAITLLAVLFSGMLTYRISFFFSAIVSLALFTGALWRIFSPARATAIKIAAGFIIAIAMLVTLLASVGLKHEMARQISRLDPATNAQESLRSLIWPTAWSIFTAYPVTGAGPGGYTRNALEFAPVDLHGLPAADLLGSAHNQYLQLLADTGLFGFTAYILFIWLVLTSAFRALLKPANPADKEKLLVISASVVSLVAIHVYGLTLDPLYLRSFQIAIFLIAGIAVALSADLAPKPAAQDEVKPKFRMALKIAAISAIAGSALRLATIFAEQPLPTFTAGMYNYEKFDGSVVGAWTAERALLQLKPGTPKFSLPIKSYMPGVETNRQKVELRLIRQTELAGMMLKSKNAIFAGRNPGLFAEIDIADHNWHYPTFELPASETGIPITAVIRVTPGFVPAETGLNPTDFRRLGVAVGLPQTTTQSH